MQSDGINRVLILEHVLPISKGRHLIDRISDCPNPRGFTKGVSFVCLNRYIQVNQKTFGQSKIRSIRVLRDALDQKTNILTEIKVMDSKFRVGREPWSSDYGNKPAIKRLCVRFPASDTGCILNSPTKECTNYATNLIVSTTYEWTFNMIVPPTVDILYLIYFNGKTLNVLRWLFTFEFQRKSWSWLKLVFKESVNWTAERNAYQHFSELGGNPGLVIMGDDSFSRGRGFKSQHHILDGHFFTLICCKNGIVCLKRPKIN